MTQKSLESANAAMGRAYNSIRPIMRGAASTSFTVREGMDRTDYANWRPSEATPKARKEIINACNDAYKHVSPIKNIIDMMTDFTTEGIRLVHPNSQVQKFYNHWFNYVNGYDRSQHFANNYYLFGTAAAKRLMGKLSQRVVDSMQKGLMAIAEESDIYDVRPESPTKPARYVIPMSYDFVDPKLMVVVGDDLSIFAGKPIYGYEIPYNLFDRMKNPRTELDKQIVAQFPPYVTKAIADGTPVIVFDQSRISVSHYKKNDWESWSTPLLSSILDDITMLKKMKLSDLAALDGVISHIRIWKLGSLSTPVPMIPTQAAFDKLEEVLQYASNGQSFDIMWGPDIELHESTSDIYKYLGQEKYIPVWASIYSGLGVPPSLVGGMGGDKGFTNNSMSLKTIVERLNYGRRALKRFWEHECKLVQEAMQFRFPAQVEFANAILTDEASFRSMIIDLLDRDVVSIERVHQHLGYIPEIEEALVKRQWKDQTNKKVPPKAGPFHDPEHDFAYKKIFSQLGVVTPSELGLELEARKAGERTALDMREALKVKQEAKRVGVQGQGRPKNSQDTTTRKTKTVVPRTAAQDAEFVELFLWAKSAQQSISDILNPVYLKQCNKKNMRSLTVAETEDIEHLKFSILCNLEPAQPLSREIIGEIIKRPLRAHPEADKFWQILVANVMQKKGGEPSIDDIRDIQSCVYALYKGDFGV